MKHLKGQLFICEKDFKDFKQGEWYASVGVCNEYISLVIDSEYIPVHGTDLVTNFKLVDSVAVLRQLLFSLQASRDNTHLQGLSAEYVLDVLLADAKQALSTFKTAAV